MAVREPWDGFLRLGMPIISGLTFANTFLVFLLAVITAASTHFTASDDPPGVGKSCVAQYELRMRADIILFYVTIPAVMLIESASSNYCLWTDKLRPTYVAVVSVLTPALWIAQLSLWSICLFVGNSEAVAKCDYCPNIFKTAKYGVYPTQAVGTDEMEVWAVPSLFLLYAITFVFVLIARKHEPRQRRRHDAECVEQKWYAPLASKASADETLDFVPKRLQLRHPNKPRASADQSMNRLDRQPV